MERLTKAQERELVRAYSQALKTIRADIALAFERYDGNYAEMSKYNRLRNLEGQIGEQIRLVTGKSAVNLKSGAMQAFSESYYRTGYVLETEVMAKLGWGMLDPKVIEKAIINPFDRYGTKRKDSLGFLVRNSENSQKLFQQLRQELTQALIQGKSYQETARIIKKRIETGATNVLRIARTENHRCQVSGTLKGFDQAESKGVEMDRVWSATLDERTRSSHGAMDGQKANKEGLFNFKGMLVEGPGLTGTVDDIWCRCRPRAEVKGYPPNLRRVRRSDESYQDAIKKEKEQATREGREPRPVSRSEVLPYKTYDEWKKERISK